MALFYLCHYTIGGIQPYISVTNCRSEYRVQNRIDDFHTVRLEAFFVNQRYIELLNIAVFNGCDIFLPDVRSDILIIHIDVIASCRVLQFVLQSNVLVPKGIERHLSCFIHKKIILQVLFDLLFHFPKRFRYLLALRHTVGCNKLPAIYRMPFSIVIGILKFIFPVRSLRFACP